MPQKLTVYWRWDFYPTRESDSRAGAVLSRQELAHQRTSVSGTSENRRVQRKLAGLAIDLAIVAKSEFRRSDSFDEFCLHYAAERMDGQMPRERFDYVFARSTCNTIFTFEALEKPVGYVLASVTQHAVQYWFSFFDLGIMQEYPIGKWMMWKIIDWAVQTGREYVYLGTCYGTKSLYKVRDFKGLEFFDGYAWNRDMKSLKQKCKGDAERSYQDDLKSSPDMADHLANVLRQDKAWNLAGDID